MQLVNTTLPFTFTYPAYDENTNLYIMATIFNVTSGTPVLLTTVILADTQNGVYSGNYTGQSSQAYLVTVNSYTDNTYSTVDTTRAPYAECYHDVLAVVTFICFNYGAYDLNTGLYIQAQIYDTTTGIPSYVSSVNMAHVLNGVYFGSYTCTLNHSYVVPKFSYTSNTYLTLDTTRAPGSDIFQASVFGTLNVVNNFKTATLSNAVLTPSPLPYSSQNKITFTQGDNATLNLIAQNGLGTPINLTNATFSTIMIGAGGALIVFPNSQHLANANQITNTGQFTLTLAQADTANVNYGNNKEIVTIITIYGNQIYYHGVGILNVLFPAPMN